ncbi:Zn-ribbon domain-containing OB-fold protein [Streptomyces yaizuensis]|uniref:Zinc ribbon domain-containing protein n=1 Tax=Streptomyces yaizuensis TaxID=2989713 RepID=A0ABQ5NSM7_9ACTN|nr:zinc ribbon domain-containing protein [Streptomyces sp. YSPA8]GLF93155.1 zinc ribbon domain-containing protein [Streptomyces sp. YSPA8]
MHRDMSQPGACAAPPVRGESGLIYQRCRWCGTASFRRMLCPVCASSDLESACSEGEGVVIQSAVVNRYTRVARNESLVRFPEGFTLRCRVVGTAPHLVWVGARVRPTAGTDPRAGEAVLEICDPVTPVSPY